MKKAWKCCSALMLTAMILMMMVGCLGGKGIEIESGDFIFSSTNGEIFYLSKLTEEGKKKRVLIVPEEIEGHQIKGISNKSFVGPLPIGQSKNLEKIYLPWDMYVYELSFCECDNLSSIFILSYRGAQAAPFLYVFDRKVYISRYVYDDYPQLAKDYSFLCPANITYYYNDGRTENYGCYWIDNVPYGSVLDVLPPEDQVSEGKTFAGWYKEPECINEWNFETDTTPEEKVDEEGNIIYQETALYAKWV